MEEDEEEDAMDSEAAASRVIARAAERKIEAVG